MTVLNNNHNKNHEREFAWRVFAGEYNRSTLELKPDDERAPGYIVTPLGAKINRVFIVGVLTELEKLERNGKIHYRARISDRTGVFYVYAGQFDPKTTKVLSNLEPPAYVAVIGKSRIYSPSEGVNYVSIRPENIIEVDKTTRDYWLLDACQSMKDRLEAMNELRQMEEPSFDNLIQLGYLPGLAQGLLDAREHYNDYDITRYREMLVDVLKFLVIGNRADYINQGSEMNLNIQEFTSEFKTGDEIGNDVVGDDNGINSDELDMEFEFDHDDESDVEDNDGPELIMVNNIPDLEGQEKLLIDVIGSFKGKKYNDGVPWHELVVKADSAGVNKLYIEDVVNSLLNKGKVYEPMLGRIKLMN